jgi:hypothetical protein
MLKISICGVQGKVRVVVVQVGAVKIYVTVVEVLRKKGKTG